MGLILSGTGKTLRSAATLTNSYVASSSIDLLGFNSVTVRIKSSAADAGKILHGLFEWSDDDTTYYKEQSVSFGVVSGDEIPGSFYDYKLVRAMDNQVLISFRAVAQDRYFRMKVKEAAGTSTATVTITATPRNV
jgi:hypothetical protein